MRETGNTEPILVEYGFIDNPKDAQKLKNNLLDYVEGVVKAIAEYSGYPYFSNEEALNTYTVQKGDTLYSISRKFNISVDTLKKINNLSNNLLSIGQNLILTEEETLPNGSTYTVQKGDTLYSISKIFDVSIEDIKKINNMKENTLYIGQELIIPKQNNTNEDDNLEENEYSFYTVIKGDSLWEIAKKFGIPVTELINMNNLTNLTLQIGQQLLVPKVQEDLYIVKAGDTLWSVARENGLDVNTLKELNNLSSNLLSVGQILRIK